MAPPQNEKLQAINDCIERDNLSLESAYTSMIIQSQVLSPKSYIYEQC